MTEKPDTDSIERSINAALNEYNSLRQESLGAISARTQILGFVFTGLAIVIATVSVADRIPDPIAAGILTLFIPTLAKLSIIGWLSEYQRSQRAGVAVADLELRVNYYIDCCRTGSPARPSPMTWENSLVSSSQHLSWSYKAVLLMLYLLGLTGTVLGTGRLWGLVPEGTSPSRFVSLGGVLVVLLLLDAGFAWYYRKVWHNSRQTYENSGSGKECDGWRLDFIEVAHARGAVRLHAWVRNIGSASRSSAFVFRLRGRASELEELTLHSRWLEAAPDCIVAVDIAQVCAEADLQVCEFHVEDRTSPAASPAA